MVTWLRSIFSGLLFNFLRKDNSERASAELFSVSCAVDCREFNIRSAITLRIPPMGSLWVTSSLESVLKETELS